MIRSDPLEGTRDDETLKKDVFRRTENSGDPPEIDLDAGGRGESDAKGRNVIVKRLLNKERERERGVGKIYASDIVIVINVINLFNHLFDDNNAGRAGRGRRWDNSARSVQITLRIKIVNRKVIRARLDDLTSLLEIISARARIH